MNDVSLFTIIFTWYILDFSLIKEYLVQILDSWNIVSSKNGKSLGFWVNDKFLRAGFDYDVIVNLNKQN